MPPVERFVSAGGLRLHVRDWGGPASRPPVLLVHGLASNARIWDLVASRLAGSLRVAAHDQRGHGRSDKPDAGYDFASVTADLAAVCGALGFERPLVVGHSWGAAVALQLAADCTVPLSGVALVDGGTFDFAAMMSPADARRRLTPPRLSGTPLAEFVHGMRTRWLRELWSPEVEEIVLANFEVDEAAHIHPRLSFDNHMQVVDAMVAQRPGELFPRVACPALIIPAAPPVMDDEAARWMQIKRASVAAAEQAIPYARVAWAEQSVHDIPLHRPELLASLLADFAHSITRPVER
ncbi:MAG: hypothetical protein RLZZ387_2721 [Chloroflexota bacterium]